MGSVMRECGVRSVEWRVWSGECGVWNVKCEDRIMGIYCQMALTCLPVKVLADVKLQNQEAMRHAEATADVECDIIAMSGNQLGAIRLKSGVSWGMQLWRHPALNKLEQLLGHRFEVFHGKEKVFPDTALSCVVSERKETKLVLLLVHTKAGSASPRILITAGAKRNELPCAMPMFALQELAFTCEPGELDEVELGELPAMLCGVCVT